MNTDSLIGVQKYNNGQAWEVMVTFNNHDTDPYILPSHAILELVIEEDLLDWPFKGYMIYNNIYEGFERNFDTNNKDNKKNKGVVGYSYRMDGRDEITISMKPLIWKKTKDNKNPFADYPEIWNINIECVVYDTEDLPSSDISTKTKKIYFWDKKYQHMLDKKIQWSTATAKTSIKYPSRATDSQRSMYTGNAIKSLLTAAGYGDNIDNDNWDIGKTKILYTIPADCSIYDSLKYLLRHHISANNKNDIPDICILSLNRYTNKFSLKSIHDYFSEACTTKTSKAGSGRSAIVPGRLQREHLFFEDLSDTKPNTEPFKAPLGEENTRYNIDIKMNEWSKISTYQFTDTSGLDNAKAFISKPVYWYNNKLKQFGVDVEENEIQKVKEQFNSLYVSQLLPVGKAAPIFTLNDSKKNQYQIEPKFSYAIPSMTPDKNSRVILGSGEILMAGLFLNGCLSVRLIGSTHRTAGVFIGVDRMAYSNDERIDKFDNKLCGQWFVVNVKHIWKNNKYTNDIVSVKGYSYKDLKIKENGIE